MSGSEWESIQNSFKKRIVFSLILIIPLCLIGGVFFYNNRDFFNNFRNGNAPEQLEKSISTIPEMIDNVSVDSIGYTELDSTYMPQRKFSDTGGSEEENVTITRSSVILPEFECRTFDRGDLKLLMSIELFFSGGITDNEVALMRNDLKVIIRQLVRNRELGSIKKEILKSEIIRVANEMLGVESFTDLKFVDFKIEKAVKQ